MTPVLVALAVLVAVGGIVAVSAREPRFAVLGVIIVLVGGAYVADPLPGLVGLGARLAGAVLAGYLLWVALRKAPAPTAGWQVGWPGATALAAGRLRRRLVRGRVARDGARGDGGEGPSTAGVAAALVGGSPVARAALAAAFALVALGAAPVLVARDVLRLGVGLLLLIAAAGLVGNALGARRRPGDPARVRCLRGDRGGRHRGARRHVDPAALRPGAPRLAALASRRSITGPSTRPTCDGRRRATTSDPARPRRDRGDRGGGVGVGPRPGRPAGRDRGRRRLGEPDRRARRGARHGGAARRRSGADRWRRRVQRAPHPERLPATGHRAVGARRGAVRRHRLADRRARRPPRAAPGDAGRDRRRDRGLRARPT